MSSLAKIKESQGPYRSSEVSKKAVAELKLTWQVINDLIYQETT